MFEMSSMKSQEEDQQDEQKVKASLAAEETDALLLKGPQRRKEFYDAIAPL